MDIRIHAFKSLQIVNNQFSANFSSVVLPVLHFNFAFGLVLITVIVVGYNHELSSLSLALLSSCAISMGISFIFSIPFEGKVYHESMVLIRSFKAENTNSKRKYTNSNSLRPLKIQLYDFFYFNKNTTLGALGFLFLYTFKFIILSRKL
jgi:hypothetical protein